MSVTNTDMALIDKYEHDLRRARKRLEETQAQVSQLEAVIARLRAHLVKK